MLLAALLESSPDIIIFALDRNYRYLSFNAEHARIIRHIWGVDIQKGMNMLDIFGDHPDKIKAKANMDNALSGNRFTIVEQYGNESLARMFWEDTWAPIVDEHHEIIGLTCVVKNITEQKRSEIEYLKTNEQLNLFFEHSVNGYLFMMLEEPVFWNDSVDKEKVLDYVFAHQRLTKVNQAYLDQYGHTLDEVIGKTPNQSFASDLIQGRNAWRQLFDQGQSHIVTMEERKDKSKIWIKGDYVCIYDDQGRITGHFGTQQEITSEVEADELLRRNEELFRAIFEQAAVGISYGPLGESYGRFNQKYCEIVGYTPEELRQMSFADITHPDDVELDKEYLRRMVNGEIKNYSIDKRFIQKNGNIVWTHLSASIIQHSSENKSYILAILQDIDQKKRSEQEMRHLNYHDHLTGLYNRRFYEEELRRLDVARNLPITLVMIDANGLKLMNDAFGHEIGDQYLIRIAQILKQVCRQDEIIARIGGDEFVILLPKTEEKVATEIIRRIHEAIGNEKIEGVYLSLSIGSATKDDPEIAMRDLFKQAEDTMYRQKLTDSSSTMSKTIDVIMNSLYEKNSREMSHSRRVSEICEAIAAKMNFDKSEIHKIKVAGLMHDIGKIGIPDSILNKVEPLTEMEWKEIKSHSEVGYRILSSVNEFSELSEFVLAHHERWDGKGYPKGLRGAQIPIQARIIGIADAFDAMTSDRTYRRSLSVLEACEEIKQHAGTQFDPVIARIFLDYVVHELRNDEFE